MALRDGRVGCAGATSAAEIQAVSRDAERLAVRKANRLGRLLADAQRGRAAFGEEPGHEALAFRYALDLDRDRVDCLLESLHSLRRLRSTVQRSLGAQPRRHMFRAIAIAIGNPTKIVPTIVMPVICPGLRPSGLATVGEVERGQTRRRARELSACLRRCRSRARGCADRAA